MSVPADMLARMGKQASPQPLPGGGTAGPAGMPMASPTNKEGDKAVARTKIHTAMTMLQAALGMFGGESEEGKLLTKTLTTLAKKFGDNDDSDLVPAEVKELYNTLPQMGGGSEMQKQIAQLMQSRQGAGPQPAPAAA